MGNSRKQFSLQDKVKLIEACKTKSQSKVAQEFSVAKGTLNGFLKDKIKIMEQFEKSSPKSVHRKRQREGEHPEEEEALYLWFNEKRLQGVMPSGGVIKEKAKQIAASKGKQLNASDGWLHNWKNRFNDELETTVSNAEVINSLKNLRTFTQKQGLSESWVKTFFNNMEKEMLREVQNKKQANIKDYFEKLL